MWAHHLNDYSSFSFLPLWLAINLWCEEHIAYFSMPWSILFYFNAYWIYLCSRLFIFRVDFVPSYGHKNGRFRGLRFSIFVHGVNSFCREKPHLLNGSIYSNINTILSWFWLCIGYPSLLMVSITTLSNTSKLNQRNINECMTWKLERLIVSIQATRERIIILERKRYVLNIYKYKHEN